MATIPTTRTTPTFTRKSTTREEEHAMTTDTDTQPTLSPRTVKALRRMCERTVAPTYAPNKMVHDGLFEVAYCEGMDDVLLAFLIEAEAATGQEFSYEVKSTRVRVGLAGTYL